jgi:dihydrodipicolinate synthase/N-acetylneuraminate lyase
MVDAIAVTGYMGTSKAVMGRLGVPVGPARAPHRNPTAGDVDAVMARLAGLGFTEWGAAAAV